MISRYGYDVVAAVLVVSVIGAAAAWFFVDARPVKFILIGVFALLLVFTVHFFRDPERSTPGGRGLVIAPADGEVVQVVELREEEYLRGDAVQVSIFMSPLNVHVNRWPVSGTVGYFKHFPGEYLVAMDDKSSLRNERTHIGVETEGKKVLFKQIAGFIARRIVAEVTEGDSARAGERFGMIRFGSRVDVLLPRGSEIRVRKGDRTVAGETVLAVLS